MCCVATAPNYQQIRQREAPEHQDRYLDQGNQACRDQNPRGTYSLTELFPPLFLSFDYLPPSLLHLRGSISGDSSSHHEPVAGNRASLNHHTTLERPNSTHTNMTKHSSAHITGARVLTNVVELPEKHWFFPPVVRFSTITRSLLWVSTLTILHQSELVHFYPHKHVLLHWPQPTNTVLHHLCNRYSFNTR